MSTRTRDAWGWLVLSVLLFGALVMLGTTQRTLRNVEVHLVDHRQYVRERNRIMLDAILRKERLIVRMMESAGVPADELKAVRSAHDAAEAEARDLTDEVSPPPVETR
jgi:hypothetical protein